MSKIVIFGDSITQGALDLEKGGWAERLRLFLWDKNIREIGCYYEGPDAYIFGVGGDTTDDVIERFDAEIKTVPGKIERIILAIGVNDATHPNKKKRNNKEYFGKNIIILLKKAEKIVDSKNIYFLGLTKENESIETKDNNQRTEEFDKIIERIIEQGDWNFIPIVDLLEKNDFCYDNSHPNSRGHEKIFQRVKEYLGL